MKSIYYEEINGKLKKQNSTFKEKRFYFNKEITEKYFCLFDRMEIINKVRRPLLHIFGFNTMQIIAEQLRDEF